MEGRRTRTAVLLGVALLVVLAGCSGAGDADDAEKTFAGGDGGDGATAARGDAGDRAATSDGSGGGSESGDAGAPAMNLQARQLVRTGEVHLQVASFGDARANVTGIVGSVGGFVSDSARESHSEGNRTWVTGELVVRVPSGNFSTAFERVKAAGEVERASSNTEDVTDQLVDMEARLENLRSQRERLRDLYEQANETDDVLQVGRRLSDVQEQIERLEAKRQSLREQVAYSTITVTLAEPRPERPTVETTAEPAWHETPVTAAFVDSVHGAAVVLRASAVALAYAAPYLAVFGLPAAALALWRRREPGGEPVAEDRDEEPSGEEPANGDADGSGDDPSGE